MKKAWLTVTACLLTVSCSSTSTPDCLYNCAPSINASNHNCNSNHNYNGHSHNNHAAITETQRLALLKYLENQVKKQWGNKDYLQAGRHRYVKYFDGYRTRAHINFDNGKIYVSTVANYAPKATLKKAIEETLLMPADPSQVDIFSDKSIPLNGKPFLLGQVKDHENKNIHWLWRAAKYADYLIANKLKTKKFQYGTAYYVEIDMVNDHLEQREYQYADIIRQAAKRYNIDEDLIYAIVKTESSFNPYAVSHAGAYGLMQIIPKTAGADVFNLVKNKPGIPTKEYLFNPTNNIDTGAAYFYILKNRYLKEIQHPRTKDYAMISAYNGGTGGVLATFDPDRKQAMKDINHLQPNQVYWALTNKHPKAEARRYLEKVLNFQKEFESM